MQQTAAPESLQRNYPLGRNAHEYERLMRQSRLLRPMCRRMLVDMGLGTGMRVLDLGCGPGDLSLLAAELVGENGSVLGVDHDAGALELASQRARDTQTNNVRFIQSDLNHLPAQQNFDAVIGRYVLMYQADPAATLAELAQHIQPGGVLGCIEPWIRPPETDLGEFGKTIRVVYDTMRHSGAVVDMGARLHRTFMEAGLPVPQMRYEILIDGSPDSEIADYLRDTLASLLPAAETAGLAKPEDFDLEALPGQIRDEFKGFGIPLLAGPTIAAWCRV